MELAIKALNKLGDLVGLRASKRGAMQTFRHIPDLASLVYAGKVWSAKEATTTTAATAVPTTTAGFTLQNPNGSAKVYVGLQVFFELDVNAATLEATSIVHMRNSNAVANFTRDVTTVSPFCAGRGAYDGQAILDAGATVVDNGWQPIGGQTANVKNSAAWGQHYVNLDVPTVLLPGGAWSLELISSSATTEAALGFVWAELDADDLE